jgi:hypothetical protein
MKMVQLSAVEDVAGYAEVVRQSTRISLRSPDQRVWTVPSASVR